MTWHEEQVSRLGLYERMIGVRSIETAPDDFMAAMEGGSARLHLLGLVESAALALTAAGADTVVPAGALIPVVLWDGGNTIAPRSVSLLNCVAVAARAAAGYKPMPERVESRPRAAVNEFLNATGGPIVEPPR